MLQPNQPIGQQAPQGMQRAPGQQTMPAGAAMQRGILPGGIASNPEDIKAAYGGTPQGQQKLQQAAGQGDYLSAIALSQILEEERQRAATKATQTTEGGKPPPVVDRMREEAVDLRRQDLEEQQAKRLGMENQRSQSAMAQMAMQAARPQMQGVAGLPAPNVAQPRAMAAGGIVAFADGGDVEPKVTEEEARPVGANPYIGMSPRAMSMKYATEQMGASRDEAERRKREEYLKFAGYSPEEKARQEKRIAEMEAYDREAYNPERLRNEGLASFLMGAANTGNIGETLSRAGQSGLNYSNKMRELSRQRMGDRQKQAETWDEAQRGARVKGFEAGTAEGKETLQGQRTGATLLGDILQADTSAARTAASGAGADSKEEARVAALIARDPFIDTWKRSLIQMGKDGMSDTPDYNALVQKITDRQNEYYKRAKLDTLTPPPITEPEVKPKEEPWSLFGENKRARENLGLGGMPQARGGLPQGIPPGSVKIGTSGGNPVYETPDGKKLVVKQ